MHHNASHDIGAVIRYSRAHFSRNRCEHPALAYRKAVRAYLEAQRVYMEEERALREARRTCRPVHPALFRLEEFLAVFPESRLQSHRQVLQLRREEVRAAEWGRKRALRAKVLWEAVIYEDFLRNRWCRASAVERFRLHCRREERRAFCKDIEFILPFVVDVIPRHPGPRVVCSSGRGTLASRRCPGPLKRASHLPERRVVFSENESSGSRRYRSRWRSAFRKRKNSAGELL